MCVCVYKHTENEKDKDIKLDICFHGRCKNKGFGVLKEKSVGLNNISYESAYSATVCVV